MYQKDKIEKWLVKKGRYIFDKRIFIGFYLFCVVFLIVVLAYTIEAYGFTAIYKPEVYVNCNSKYPCLNPFYDKCNAYNCGSNCKQFCNQEYLFPGTTYGTKEPAYYNKGINLIIGYFIACFIFNHFVFNRGFKFKESKEKLNIENEPNKPN